MGNNGYRPIIYHNGKAYIEMRAFAIKKHLAENFGKALNNDFINRMYVAFNKLAKLYFTPSEIGSFIYCRHYNEHMLEVMLTERRNLIYNIMYPEKDNLTESQAKMLLKYKGNENYVDPKKVLLIKKYLDKGFKRGAMNGIGDDGYPSSLPIVAMIGIDGTLLKNMTARQLFYLLQDRFSHILSDKVKRDRLLKKVMIDWYNKKISDGGLLSSNFF